MDSAFKSISAKIPRTEYSLIMKYCEQKGITISSLIRDLLLTEIKTPLPNNVAGKNIIKYNKETDSFAWNIKLDNDTELELIKNLSSEYLTQLQETLTKAINERNNNLNKKENNSIPIPDNLIRRGNK
jgi:hypothetical protein